MRVSSVLFFSACTLFSCAARPTVSEPRTPPVPVVVEAPVPVHPLEDEPAGRLPEGVDPLRYALSLEITPSNDRFRGTVDIRIRTTDARSGFWLHGHGLEVSSAELRVDGRAPFPARWVAGRRAGIASVQTEQVIPAGEFTLHLEWSAPFNRQLEGLYRVDTGGDSYAFTQFEALSARKAFPGFDEPRFKTPFEITLTVPRGQRAITNTPETGSSEGAEGLQVFRFAPTLPLPTYLLAFAVGPLDIVEAPPIPPNETRTTPLPLRGVAARGRGAFLQRALTDAGPLVQMMERYFNRAYPYQKLDLIAVPDFAFGAMENAGAITFREALLLVRPNAPADQLRGVDAVLAHELAHHWFGDLVTLRWWDDLWLNESFATWMGTKATEAVFPEHRIALALLTGQHNAMGTDALSTSVAIRRPINTDEDLRAGSASIIYQKGAAVLGMFERWMGADAFRDAIRAYLREHEHGLAIGADLFSALARQAGDRPLEASVRSFVEQPGVPLIEMELACDASDRRVVLQQSRFVLPAGTTPPAAQWIVPVCVRFPEGTQANSPLREVCGISDGARTTLSLGAGACPAWIVPNAEASGYYRWTLSAPLRNALVAQGWTRLSPAERLSVVNNARAAFTRGILDAAAIRPIVTRAASDTERLVAIEPLPFWTRVVEEELTGADAERARAEARRLYARAWSSVGWTARPQEGPEQGLLRQNLAAFLGLTMGDPAVRTQGARLGEQWIAATNGQTTLPPEVAGAAIGMYLRTGGARAVEQVMARALASDDAIVRSRLLSALGHAAEPQLTQQVLPLALDSRLRVNELFWGLNTALERAETRSAAFDWLRAHSQELFGRISLDARGGTPWMGARFCRTEDQARVRSMFEPIVAAVPGSEAQLRAALEVIAVCAAERSAQSAGLAAAFRSRGR